MDNIVQQLEKPLDEKLQSDVEESSSDLFSHHSNDSNDFDNIEDEEFENKIRKKLEEKAREIKT